MDQKQTGGNGNVGRLWVMQRGRRNMALALTLLVVVVCTLWGAVPNARASVDESPLAVVIDTDTGVDDATAIAWLLAQTERDVEILGFATVAGNTSVKNAANNVLTLLDAAGQPNVPVIIGADRPHNRQLSRIGALTHGPDGLWFAGLQHPHDLSGLSNDVPAFYRDVATAHPGSTLIALGPLTNLAKTLKKYPEALYSFERIIILGGSKLGGNRTPVAETNIFIDPESADLVLKANPPLPLTIITRDAFSEVTVAPDEIGQFAQSSVPVAQLIAGPLEYYRRALTMGAEGAVVGVPDVAAAMYAIDPEIGVEQSALVKVVTDSRLARGQTVIGVTLIERLTMIASDKELSNLADRAFTDPNFNQAAEIGAFLLSEPDNARVVLDVAGDEMQERLIAALTTP